MPLAYDRLQIQHGGLFPPDLVLFFKDPQDGILHTLRRSAGSVRHPVHIWAREAVSLRPQLLHALAHFVYLILEPLQPLLIGLYLLVKIVKL